MKPSTTSTPTSTRGSGCSASTCASAASRRSRPTSFCSTVGARNSTCPASVARPADPSSTRRSASRRRSTTACGTGKDVEFLLDLNFNFKTEGYIRLVRALERHRLM